jgi:hypothetical protein
MSNGFQDLPIVDDEIAIAIGIILKALSKIKTVYTNPIDKILGKAPAIEVFWSDSDIQPEANNAYDLTYSYTARIYLPVVKMSKAWKQLTAIRSEVIKAPLSDQNLGGLCYWWRPNTVTPFSRTNLQDNRIVMIGLEAEFIVKRGETK